MGSCRENRGGNVEVEEMEEEDEAGKVVAVLVADGNADVLNDRTLRQPETLKGKALGNHTEQQPEQELRRGNRCCGCHGRADLAICERNILKRWVGKMGEGVSPDSVNAIERKRFYCATAAIVRVECVAIRSSDSVCK
jgi:hypothetical protein